MERKYLAHVYKMLKLCEIHNIDIQIRSVITKINGDSKALTDFYDFLIKFECIKEWDITPFFYSQYRASESKEYAPYNQQLSFIYHFSKDSGLKFPIRLNKINKNGYKASRYDSKEKFMRNNPVCLANFTSLSILANGNCSLCEMLYENPFYLMGNVRDRSIREIWNSKKALELYAPKRENVDSKCADCELFQKCKASQRKRVCYLNIHKIGGCFDDPDPACPMGKEYDLLL